MGKTSVVVIVAVVILVVLSVVIEDSVLVAEKVRVVEASPNMTVDVELIVWLLVMKTVVGLAVTIFVCFAVTTSLVVETISTHSLQ